MYKNHLQLWPFAYKRLLSKPYVNGVQSYWLSKLEISKKKSAASAITAEVCASVSAKSDKADIILKVLKTNQ